MPPAKPVACLGCPIGNTDAGLESGADGQRAKQLACWIEPFVKLHCAAEARQPAP
jgi:hypothetical protein